MADAFSNYLRDALNDHLRGGTAYSPAATHYYELMNALPTAAGGGTPCPGFTRLAFTNNGSNYSAASAGVKQNANPLVFGNASTNTGVIVGLAVWDASSGGNLLAIMQLNTPTSIASGNPYQIDANSGVISPDPACAWSLYLQDKLLDLVFGATSWTAPSDTYFALMVVVPDLDGTGGTEASGGTYGRVDVLAGTGNWPASSGQLIDNAAVIDWGTATSNLGDIAGVAEFDASSGGNLLTVKAFTGGSVTINIGTPFQLPVAAFQDIWQA